MSAGMSDFWLSAMVRQCWYVGVLAFRHGPSMLVCRIFAFRHGPPILVCRVFGFCPGPHMAAGLLTFMFCLMYGCVVESFSKN